VIPYKIWRGAMGWLKQFLEKWLHMGRLVIMPPSSTNSIILFFIYLDALWVKKIGGINLQSHFSGWSQFGNLGPKNHLNLLEPF
jgi:hypothetical protein